MDCITNILVIVDPTSAEQPAVTKAGILAARFGARMELLACDTKACRELRFAKHLAAQSTEPFVLSLQPLLDELATPLRAAGIDVTTHTIVEDPLHVALADWMRGTTADLVVKDTHHHSVLRRTFITNTDWHLIRDCPVPLLLTKAKAWSKRPGDCRGGGSKSW